MRRTANISILADEFENDLTNINNLLSINKKVQLFIGFTNNFNKYQEYPIIWFPQGIYVIISPNISYGTDGATISLTLHDKMALLNGECGGTLPAAISFDQMQQEDRYGNIIIERPTIKQIIMELMNHWGGQQLGKIIINDLEQEVPQVLRWNGEEILYSYEEEEKKPLMYTKNKEEILQFALKKAYEKIPSSPNKPSFDEFLIILNETYPKYSEIQNIQIIIKNLKQTLENIKPILEGLNKEKEYLNSLKADYEERFRYSPEEFRNSLYSFHSYFSDLKKIIDKNYINNIFLQEKNTYQKCNYININYLEITKTGRKEHKEKYNRDFIYQLISDVKDLRTNAKKVESKFKSSSKISYNLNNKKYEVTLTPSHVIAFLLADYNVSKDNLYKTPNGKRIYSQDGYVYIQNGINNRTKKPDYTKIASSANAPLLNCYIFGEDKEEYLNYRFFNNFRNILARVNINSVPYLNSVMEDFNKSIEAIIGAAGAYLTYRSFAETLLKSIIDICDVLITQLSIVQESYNALTQLWTPFLSSISSTTVNSITLNEKIKEMQSQWKYIIKKLPRNYFITCLKDIYGEQEITLTIRQYGELICFSTNDNDYTTILNDLNTFQNKIKKISIYNDDIFLLYSQISAWFNKILTFTFSKTDQDGFYQKLTKAQNEIKKSNPDFLSYHQSLKNKIKNIEATLAECEKSYSQIPLMCYSAMRQWCNKNLKTYEEKISELYLDEQKQIQEDYFETIANISQNNLKNITAAMTNINNSIKKGNYIGAVKDIEQASYNLSVQNGFSELSTLIEDSQKQYQKAKKAYSFVERQWDLQNSNKDLSNIMENLIKKYNTQQLTQIAISDIQQEIEQQTKLLNELKAVLQKTIIDTIQNQLLKQSIFKNKYLTLCYRKAKQQKLKIASAPSYLDLPVPLKKSFEKTISDNFFKNIFTPFQTQLKLQLTYIKQYSAGMDIGYSLTEFTYPGKLEASPGDTIISILDKIKNTLGNFEYFYDIYGNFVFQQIRNYLNHTYSYFVIKDDNTNNDLNYAVNYINNKTVYDFYDGDIIQSYTNTPNYQQIKNDFLIWGERSTVEGQKLPIRYHLALDYRPAINSVFFFDVPPNISLTQYRTQNDFPKLGETSKKYYAAETNLFYEWVKEGAKQSQYLAMQDLITTKSKHFNSKEYFPKFGQPNKYYYDKSSGLLYQCTLGISRQYDTYKIINTYRIIKCSQKSSNFCEGDYIYDKNTQKIYRYINNNGILQKEQTSFKPIISKDFRTQLYLEGVVNEITGLATNDYYAELKNEWPKLYHIIKGQFYEDVKENFDSINYFLDILGNTRLTAEYGISNIGKRTHIISNNAINCIFEPDCSTIVILDKNPENELRKQDYTINDYNTEVQKLKDKKNQIKNWCEERKQRGEIDQIKWIEVSHQIYEQIVMGGILRSAYEEIRSQLYQFITYNEQIQLTTLPIYYLEPNVRIAVKDTVSGIEGDFIIKTLSIPLNVDGNMNISCSKAIERL